MPDPDADTRPTGTAIERILALLAEPPSHPATEAGYLDLMGSQRPGRAGPAELLMNSSTVPTIYERWWRPAGGWIAKGFTGPGMADEQRILRGTLALSPGDTVLDVACGPGNFTRALGEAVGPEGLAIGLDASASMLDRAVADTDADQVGYVHTDATELPLRPGSVQAVCCYAALHLFAEPMRALDAMAQVLAPGGRIALLASCRPQWSALRVPAGLFAEGAGLVLFDPDDITTALRARGFEQIQQQINGAVQFVGAVRPVG